MTLKQRKITLVIISLCLFGVVGFMYGPTEKLVSILRTHSYQYSYYPSNSIKNTPVAKGEAAIAVPILMYHGVRVEGELESNTTHENFINQMEMLKKEGYQTISVAEFDLFQQGKFELPSKPIVLTFDDGRKDSFYTVDTILKKLGFKATIFIASAKPNDDDPFFLSWNELKKLKDTNRWEIEAHGRNSHEPIIIDGFGTKGVYLSSRIYDSINGLESEEDFEKRIEGDYIDSINDLYNNLHIKSRYYAVPLNDYGNEPSSNYSKAISINKELTKKYFKAEFIECLSDGHVAQESFYNYVDTNPYLLKRLEVKEMSADELKNALNKYYPSKPETIFPAKSRQSNELNNIQAIYGNLNVAENVLSINPTPPSSAARVLFGDKGWKNYKVEAEITRGSAREAWLILYYLDEDSLVLIDWDATSINIIQRVNGVDTVIKTINSDDNNDGPSKISAMIKDNYLSVWFGNVQLIESHYIDVTRGAPGFGMWDPNGNTVTLNSYLVTSLD